MSASPTPSTAAAILPLLTVAAALAITLWKVPRTALRLTIAAGICLSLLATPIAEDHQFVLLAIPLFILAADAPELRAWLIGVVVLLWLPRAGRGSGSWMDGGLSSYPRLYATWVLWALTIAAARLWHP